MSVTLVANLTCEDYDGKTQEVSDTNTLESLHGITAQFVNKHPRWISRISTSSFGTHLSLLIQVPLLFLLFVIKASKSFFPVRASNLQVSSRYNKQNRSWRRRKINAWEEKILSSNRDGLWKKRSRKHSRENNSITLFMSVSIQSLMKLHHNHHATKLPPKVLFESSSNLFADKITLNFIFFDNRFIELIWRQE